MAVKHNQKQPKPSPWKNSTNSKVMKIEFTYWIKLMKLLNVDAEISYNIAYEITL